MDDDRSERIRQRAHDIWESEGRPQGREQQHWDQAEREIGPGTAQADAAKEGARLPDWVIAMEEGAAALAGVDAGEADRAVDPAKPVTKRRVVKPTSSR